ncbi:plasmid replication protein RepC [Salipiger abyssi]|uniref:Replication initiation protein RepC n=1 Tax=Salipiger abyssi TaxID=1250539 RepID=A0A1P8ULY4_9RHOB|nr:plasmid replication protein RepC [Salipiger abyssi]APZ50411.1 replication initiation protein RepC [Salipiger abyssi]
MSHDSQPSGWRKATAGLAIAERHARAGERAAIPKARAFTAAKRVGPQIGLKPGDLLLLDTLGAFTQPQDWTAGRRPIVWASNAYLMERTGFSLSALKRHARRLTEAGIITFRDSPNGKRWGYRDAEGVIVEAYGFDLSPLAARAEEFEQLHAELQAERTECQRLKRQITITRRMIRARIEAAQRETLDGPWDRLSAFFDDLLARLPRRNACRETLEQLLTGFQKLLERVETILLSSVEAVENSDQTPEERSEKSTKQNTVGAISDPHIQATNQLHIVTSTGSEIATTPNNKPDTKGQNDIETQRVEQSRKPQNMSDEPHFPTMVRACPEFSIWAKTMGEAIANWNDLHRIAGQLGPMIGLSKLVWNRAQEQLGNRCATAALALVFEKHCAGEVTSPSGYLYGMIRKARAGELHLDRSFHGRLKRQTKLSAL